MKKDRSLTSMMPLFLVLFIDGMGLGLLFPILNGIIADPSSGFLPHAMTLDTREVVYGCIVGVFMLCWFFGAAVLGDLSDSAGRKKTLMICLVGAFIGYLLSAIAIELQSISLLLLGRVIAGFTSGSQPVAQAAIVDVSTDEDKARNIGLIILAVSLGFVFGPIIGGVLSDHDLSSAFSYDTPLYFAAFISLLNAILLAVLFKETFYKKEKIKLKLHKGVSIFVSAFRHDKIWKLSIAMFIMICGWSNYFSFISLYIAQNYAFDTLQNSLFLASMGLGFSVGCGYLVNWCAKHFKLAHTTALSAIITGVFVLASLLIHGGYIAYFLTFLIGVGMAVAYSSIIAMFSNQVGSEEQGWVMGVTGSIMALCFGVTSIITGIIISLVGVYIALVIALLGLILSGILVFVFNGKKHSAGDG